MPKKTILVSKWSDAGGLKDRSLFGIIPFVSIAHTLAILWLVSIYSWNPPLPPPKALVVKTIKLSPPPPPPIEEIIALQPDAPLSPPKVEPIAPLPPPEVKPDKPLPPPKVDPIPPLTPPSDKLPPPAAKAPPKTKLPPPQKVPPVKKVPPPKPTAPPAPSKVEIAKEAAKAKQRNLLTQAKEKFGKINKETMPANELSLETPRQIQSLNIDAHVIDTATAVNTKESAYLDELAHRLKLFLKLPKYGEVKLRLTIDRSGHVEKVGIISFQNEDNKTYLENALPKQKLPAFGTNFPGQEDYTFTITLSNEN